MSLRRLKRLLINFKQDLRAQQEEIYVEKLR